MWPSWVKLFFWTKGNAAKIGNQLFRKRLFRAIESLGYAIFSLGRKGTPLRVVGQRSCDLPP